MSIEDTRERGFRSGHVGLIVVSVGLAVGNVQQIPMVLASAGHGDEQVFRVVQVSRRTRFLAGWAIIVHSHSSLHVRVRAHAGRIRGGTQIWPGCVGLMYSILGRRRDEPHDRGCYVVTPLQTGCHREGVELTEELAGTLQIAQLELLVSSCSGCAPVAPHEFAWPP